MNLDQPLDEVFRDRALLARVIQAVQLDHGESFMEAIERINAPGEQLGGTLRELTQTVGSDPDYIASALRLLERRDAVRDATYARAAAGVELRTNARGLVLLDQADDGTKPTVDIGLALTDPAERERRLARVRKLEAAYEGEDGRARFERDDRAHLESGLDLVRTFEMRVGQLAARRKADRMVIELDRAIADAGRKRERLKLLDAKLAELDGPLAGARDVGRQELRAQIAETDREPVKLLDQLEAAGDDLRLLDGAAPPAGEGLDRKLLDDSHYAALTRRRADLRNQANAGDPKAWSQLVLVEDGLERRRRELETPIAPAAPAAPPGVHPGSYQLDQQVRARMRELDRPDSAYHETLLELMRD